MLDPARMEDVLRRGKPDVATLVASWRGLDERRRKLQGELDSLRQARNAANERMAKLDKKSPEFAAARDGLKALAGQIKDGEPELARLEAACTDQLMVIPNAPHASVPSGAGDADNPVLHSWGDKPAMAFAPKPHDELGKNLGLLDFEGGARISGSRFTVLRREASRLNRALLREVREESFCTVAAGRLTHHERGALLTASAGGHPAPLVIRTSAATTPVLPAMINSRSAWLPRCSP